MHSYSRPRRRFTFLLLAALFLVSCRPAAEAPSPAATPFATPLSTPEPLLPLSPTPRATATPPPLPTPVPSLTPAATDTPSPEPAVTVSSPTPDPGAGLPCPATNPQKPDYERYVLSAEPWPTPDAGVPPPPLSLADPLPGSARNIGYAYGSDGSGRYLLHNGLDMADENDAVAGAAGDSVVIVARDDLDEMFGWRCDWYGRLVVLRLDEQWQGQPVYVLYGHVDDVQVVEGQHVTGGDPIAGGGTAGVAVVSHLHLEVRLGANVFGATRNPLLWLKPWPGGGVVAGRLVDPDGHAWEGVSVTLVDRRGEAPFLNTWTYLDDPEHIIRPDAALAENFVFGPVSEGDYDVYVQLQGVEYRQTVEVKDGELSVVEIVTEPYRTPTPEPSATP